MFTALAVAGWWFSPGDGFSLLYFSGQLVLAAGCVVWAVFRHRSDTVRLEGEAIVVRTRRGRSAYAWADVLEVSWQATSWPCAGGGPVLRRRGGPFDEPGPNAPAQIAHLPVFGRAASREAVRSLQRAATAHRVPYTPKLIELISTGKRMPRLPGEPRDSTRDSTHASPESSRGSSRPCPSTSWSSWWWMPLHATAVLTCRVVTGEMVTKAPGQGQPQDLSGVVSAPRMRQLRGVCRNP